MLLYTRGGLVDPLVLVAVVTRFHYELMAAMHNAMEARAGEPW
jgi:hypothetical protein